MQYRLLNIKVQSIFLEVQAIYLQVHVIFNRSTGYLLSKYMSFGIELQAILIYVWSTGHFDLLSKYRPFVIQVQAIYFTVQAIYYRSTGINYLSTGHLLLKYR